MESGFLVCSGGEWRVDEPFKKRDVVLLLKSRARGEDRWEVEDERWRFSELSLAVDEEEEDEEEEKEGE